MNCTILIYLFTDYFTHSTPLTRPEFLHYDPGKSRIGTAGSGDFLVLARSSLFVCLCCGQVPPRWLGYLTIKTRTIEQQPLQDRLGCGASQASFCGTGDSIEVHEDGDEGSIGLQCRI